MTKLGGGGQVTPELRDFYRLLFYDADPVSTVLAITTLNRANDVVRQEMNGDDLFESVTGILYDREREQIPVLIDQLQPIIVDKSLAERKDVMQNLAQYIELVGMIINKRANTFDRLDTSTEQLFTQIGNDVKPFYDELGLIEGIF